MKKKYSILLAVLVFNPAYSSSTVSSNLGGGNTIPTTNNLPTGPAAPGPTDGNGINMNTGVNGSPATSNRGIRTDTGGNANLPNNGSIGGVNNGSGTGDVGAGSTGGAGGVGAGGTGGAGGK